jgi:hypothetical protein
MPGNRTEGTPTPVPRMRRVRVTVDLEPEDHMRLRRWCNDAAEQLGRGSVAQVDVVRALLHRLHCDQELARHVMKAIEEHR